eukprot:Amastigsp_a844652_62.p3 type:complete len:141 gc:universal Amastigsp_a844652_62:845-423(-)
MYLMKNDSTWSSCGGVMLANERNVLRIRLSSAAVTTRAKLSAVPGMRSPGSAPSASQAMSLLTTSRVMRSSSVTKFVSATRPCTVAMFGTGAADSKRCATISAHGVGASAPSASNTGLSHRCFAFGVSNRVQRSSSSAAA